LRRREHKASLARVGQSKRMRACARERPDARRGERAFVHLGGQRKAQLDPVLLAVGVGGDLLRGGVVGAFFFLGAVLIVGGTTGFLVVRRMRTGNWSGKDIP